MPEESSDVRVRRGVLFWASLALLLAPVLYVASVGPAVWVIIVAGDSGMPWTEGFADVVSVAYYPLELVAEQFEPVQNFLEWYISLFDRVDPLVLPSAPLPAPITPAP